MHAGHARHLLLALALVLGACTRDTPHVTGGPAAAPAAASPTPSPTEVTPAAPGAMANTPGAPPAPAGDEGMSGTITETMDSGGYTYAKLDNGTRQVWVAGPETKLAVGTKIGTVSGTLMAGFRSTTLNRTFDEIYFIGSFPIAGSAPPNPHVAAGTPMTEMAPMAKPTELIERITPAPDGQTIAQLFAGKAGLEGKPIVVRGKVVKLNNGILGHNWLHIQDGTGAAGTNDLTITTAATVALGDVVTVRGKLATNKDFGSGYKYDVLIEDAAITAK
ncbi:MAG: DNA-binding protein [Myxococcales bacterium]|nr:DNA-binding protein [Myxococcales bacterium]